MPLHGLVRDPHHPVIFPGSAMHLPTVLTARLTPHLPGKGFLPAVFGFHQHEVTFPSPALEKTPSPVLTHPACSLASTAGVPTGSGLSALVSHSLFSLLLFFKGRTWSVLFILFT